MPDIRYRGYGNRMWKLKEKKNKRRQSIQCLNAVFGPF